jgi:hypothetical protein
MRRFFSFFITLAFEIDKKKKIPVAAPACRQAGKQPWLG